MSWLLPIVLKVKKELAGRTNQNSADAWQVSKVKPHSHQQSWTVINCKTSEKEEGDLRRLFQLSTISKRVVTFDLQNTHVAAVASGQQLPTPLVEVLTCNQLCLKNWTLMIKLKNRFFVTALTYKWINSTNYTCSHRVWLSQQSACFKWDMLPTTREGKRAYTCSGWPHSKAVITSTWINPAASFQLFCIMQKRAEGTQSVVKGTHPAAHLLQRALCLKPAYYEISELQLSCCPDVPELRSLRVQDSWCYLLWDGFVELPSRFTNMVDALLLKHQLQGGQIQRNYTVALLYQQSPPGCNLNLGWSFNLSSFIHLQRNEMSFLSAAERQKQHNMDNNSNPRRNQQVSKPPRRASSSKLGTKNMTC